MMGRTTATWGPTDPTSLTGQGFAERAPNIPPTRIATNRHPQQSPSGERTRGLYLGTCRQGGDGLESPDLAKKAAARIGRNTLGDLLSRSARRDPHKVAVIYRSTTLDYAAWNQRVDGMAHGLRAIGLRARDHVAVVSRNSLSFATLVFAVARLGAVLVPLNWALAAGELHDLLVRGDAVAVAAQAEFVDLVDAAAAGTHAVQLKLTMDGDGDPGTDLSSWRSLADLTTVDGEALEAEVTDDDVAQILFTSGTEARPKGVMLTHRAVIDESVSIMLAADFKSVDVVLHALPFYHSAQLNAFLIPFTYLGATSVILDRPTPDAILDHVRRYGVTEFFGPPTVWIALLRSPRFDPGQLTSLTKAVTGAAVTPLEILAELQRRLPWMGVYNLYGLTEVGPFALGLPPEQQAVRPGSVGRPGINVEVAILREDGAMAHPDQEGEIVLRCSHATRGYYRDPEHTNALFEGGWLHTGDVGIMDAEGYVTVVDRKKDVIKSGGVNISSREVEDVLYRHAGVEECAVIGVPHPYWIEAVVAVVKARSGANPTDEDLIQFCRSRLASFKVPKAIVFREDLPKNPSGKILKRQLRAEIEPFVEAPGDAPN